MKEPGALANRAHHNRNRSNPFNMTGTYILKKWCDKCLSQDKLFLQYLRSFHILTSIPDAQWKKSPS